MSQHLYTNDSFRQNKHLFRLGITNQSEYKRKSHNKHEKLTK